MTQETTAEANQGLRVLIIGAGIGGLAAAIALRQQGHRVEVCLDPEDVSMMGIVLTRASYSNGRASPMKLALQFISRRMPIVCCRGLVLKLPSSGPWRLSWFVNIPGWFLPWLTVSRCASIRLPGTQSM